MADKNGRSVPQIHTGNVPIVGSSVHMICSRGHVEQLGGPFSMFIPPANQAEQPVRLTICRVCWVNFVGMFGAREMTPEEIAEFQADQAADAPAVS